MTRKITIKATMENIIDEKLTFPSIAKNPKPIGKKIPTKNIRLISYVHIYHTWKKVSYLMRPHTQLGATQQKILLNLATTHPKTITEIKETCQLDYAYTHRTIKKLVHKKLLIRMPTKGKYYQGQTFDRYWLSERGLLISIVLSPGKTKEILQQRM